MTRQYFHWVTTRSTAILACYTLLAILAGLQLGNIRLDASSDSLLLQGDPDLAYFRETIGHYTSDEASGEFLILTWRPPTELLDPRSLDPLARMVEQLEGIEGVSSVTSILDVPL
ncbi:MAG: RND family transporter, partial [Luminiphilus sp.]